MNTSLLAVIKFFRLRRIGTRLALSYGVLLLLFIIVAILTQVQVARIYSKNAEFVKNDIQRMLNVHGLTLEVEGVGSQILVAFSSGNKPLDSDYLKIDQKTKRIKELMFSLSKAMSDDEEQSNLTNLIDQHRLFLSNYYDMLDELELNGLASAKELLVEQVEPSRLKLLAEGAHLLDQEKQRIQTRQIAAAQELEKLQQLIAAIFLLAILLGSFIAFKIWRSIVNPLAILEASAREIASGNYDNKVPPTKTYEVKKVGDALNIMVEAISAREKEIEQLAFYDPLTHLPNRTLLLKQVDSINLAEKSMILMDIARLKTVNETLGFATGDTVILESAKRINQVLSSSDLGDCWIAKLSGGMFAILCSTNQQEKIVQLLKQIDHHLTDPIHCGQYTVDVNLVYGVAMAITDHIKINTLIRNAEVALHSAKASTLPIVWYSDAQEASRLTHLSLLSDLRLAVQNAELQMWLQPKVKLDTMQTYGFEALVRWQHPQRGFISPIEFIPFAERTGYISVVTKWMLEQALKTLQQWKTTHPHLSIAVNVSTNDLRDQEFPNRVRDLLQQYNVQPRHLKLELTESGIMEDPSNAIPLLQKLRDIGIGLSIDDFGTGHSSLAYLQKLPVTELKIDRSFIINIDQLPSTQRLVKTIIEMGHGLELSVIAEGIETKEERDTLLSLDCDAIQGYFACKPIYGAALQAWLDKLPPA
jgi:diguanylate cyclase (GGDEF)-like protein